VKALRGTLRAHREPVNPVRPDPCAVPAPPADLTREQLRAWSELAPQVGPDGLRTYTASSFTAFRLLVKVIAMADNIPPDMPASAAVRLLQVASSLLGRFGLDPISAERVESAPRDDADDPAAEFVS
jgi:hypothetical protein